MIIVLNKYIRYFNQNRVKVIAFIGIAIFALILVYVLNDIAKNKNEEDKKRLENRVVAEKGITQSVIEQGGTTSEVAEKNRKIINEFVRYCNFKETKKAYELLSDDCKKILFPTEADFVNNYCNIVFSTYKIYEMENWISNGSYATYKIRYTNDALAEGEYKSEQTIDDYYTIVKQGEDYKLNINKFVYKEIINKNKTENNFSINIISRENYIDYQVYELNFNNKNKNSVVMYDENKKSSWEIADNNEIKYSAFTEEIADNNLKVEAGVDKKIKVKYAKMYNLNRKIEKISFINMYVENEGTPELFSFEINL